MSRRPSFSLGLGLAIVIACAVSPMMVYAVVLRVPQEWPTITSAGREDVSQLRNPPLVLPSEASTWPVGTRVWRASSGGGIDTRFSAANTCPLRVVAVGSQVHLLTPQGDSRRVLPVIGTGGWAEAFDTSHGVVVAQGGTLALWDGDGEHCVWEKGLPRAPVLRYSEAEDYFLSCGGMGSVPASKVTTVVDAGTGTARLISAGPVVDGIPIDDGFVVVRVEERSMGRSRDEENTLVAYTADGSLKWSRSVGTGWCSSLSSVGKHVVVILHSDLFHAIVVDARSGVMVFDQDLAYHGSCAATLSRDGTELVFAGEVLAVSGPCAEVGAIDISSGEVAWKTTVGCVADWDAGGGGFIVVPHLTVSSATGDIALATYWTTSAGEGTSAVFLLDAMGKGILADQWASHGGVRSLEFLDESKYLAVHAEHSCLYVAR